MSADAAKLAARLAALALAVVLVQVALFSQLSIAGGNPDLIPLAVMSVGLLGGWMAGATFGFAVGLLVDLALLQTLGVTSLVLVGVGYWAGRARELRDLSSPLVPLAAGAAATLAALVGFSLLQFLLGSDPPVGLALVRQLLATVVLNALFALPVHALVRRALGLPRLADVSRARRRRAGVPAGLSPLSSTSEGPLAR